MLIPANSITKKNINLKIKGIKSREKKHKETKVESSFRKVSHLFKKLSFDCYFSKIHRPPKNRSGISKFQAGTRQESFCVEASGGVEATVRSCYPAVVLASSCGQE